MTKEIKPVFQGELMLAGWQESHTAGAKLTFFLPDSESLEVFKGMTAKKGNVAGQRLMAVLVEIGEDEQPIEPEHPKPKGGELARLAGILCNEPAFREFLGKQFPNISSTNSTEAASLIYVVCGIQSRTELDSNEQAAYKFHRFIRVPYSQWLKDNCV